MLLRTAVLLTLPCLQVVSLPIDLCVRQAVRGNTALQGALDLALKVLQDIETFEQALQRQAIGAVSADLCGRWASCVYTNASPFCP